jgi:hypothetical protein
MAAVGKVSSTLSVSSVLCRRSVSGHGMLCQREHVRPVQYKLADVRYCAEASVRVLCFFFFRVHPPQSRAMSPIWIALIIVAGLGLIFTIFTPGPDKAYALSQTTKDLALCVVMLNLYCPTVSTEFLFGLPAFVYLHCSYSCLFLVVCVVFSLGQAATFSFATGGTTKATNKQIVLLHHYTRLGIFFCYGSPSRGSPVCPAGLSC